MKNILIFPYQYINIPYYHNIIVLDKKRGLNKSPLRIQGKFDEIYGDLRNFIADGIFANKIRKKYNQIKDFEIFLLKLNEITKDNSIIQLIIPNIISDKICKELIKQFSLLIEENNDSYKIILKKEKNVNKNININKNDCKKFREIENKQKEIIKEIEEKINSFNNIKKIENQEKKSKRRGRPRKRKTKN